MDKPDKNPVAKLVVTVQDKKISEWEILKQKTILIGRGNEVDYQIRSGLLSRQHCQIKDTGNNLELKDLNSLNGTFVNEEKVDRCFLKDGDLVKIGPLKIMVETFYHLEEHTEVPTLLQDVIRKFQATTCLGCSKSLSREDFKNYQAIGNAQKACCIQCFCHGFGNYPTIAGYRIVRKLGGGGMGDVYEAIQLSMQRPVAFKLMQNIKQASRAQIQRFFREARTGGKLLHSNIVGFIDAGSLEDAYFIAMELIDGVDVKKILEAKGPLPYLEAMRIAYYVSVALDYANSNFNIVHRDIKPENILITRENAIKLTDFGLAKDFGEAGLSGITQSRTGIGTLFYMPPEQITNARFVDHRADIYALGVSIYEMVTNQRPFVSEQMMDLIKKIHKESPRPINNIIPNLPTPNLENYFKSNGQKTRKTLSNGI